VQRARWCTVPCRAVLNLPHRGATVLGTLLPLRDGSTRRPEPCRALVELA